MNTAVQTNKTYFVVGVVIELELVNEEPPHAHRHLSPLVSDASHCLWDGTLNKVACAV